MDVLKTLDALHEVEKTIMMLSTRVPKRDYDASLGALRVCQNTIETLMQALFKLEPTSQEVADARTILMGLEEVINPIKWKIDKFIDDPEFIEDMARLFRGEKKT